MRTIHFLQAADGTRLTKHFKLTEEGTLQKEPYPQVYAFNSDEVEAETIGDLFAQLVAHADHGQCLLKGKLDRPLKNESRAGHTNSDDATDWLVLDNDNLHDVEPQQLMDLLGLGDVDYIIQYSASAGIEPHKKGYHIFVLLDRPWSPADLKLRLRAWNLDVPQIREHFQLSRTNSSLRWPLDVSVCQNDKLIYIAPPSLGPGVQSTLEGDRIRLAQGSKRFAALQPPTETDQLLKERENAVLNALRNNAGLPEKKFEARSSNGQIVAKNPDQAQVTGTKEQRDFVYLNLNGGDSWGYYHPVTSPEVLYNFKGEPNYLIEELLPDYYPQAKERAEQARGEQQLELYCADMDRQTERLRRAEAHGDRVLCGFRDKRSDTYYVGWIDPKDKTHEFHPIGAKSRMNELFVQHGEPQLEIVPSVDFLFEPANDALYDYEAGFINRYMPSPYLKQAQSKEDAQIPPAIQRVIQHALGDDPVVVEHFLNWFAVIFQYRERTQAAWILQGTTGTGKGLLFSKIIRPLIGEDYCRVVNLTNLEDQFNAFAERTIVLFIDEVDTDQVTKMAKLMARLKSMITEPKIPLRAMRTDLREVPNHINLIFSSNRPNSMRIEANDRRFNVCPRQETKLLEPGESGDELVSQIQSELQDFGDYLMSRDADKAKARRALNNEPKRLLQAVTQTAIEEVAEALRNGDLGYFMDQRPTTQPDNVQRSPVFNSREVQIRAVYREVLADALEAADAGTKHVLHSEQLFAIFELLVGNMPKTKTKLTKRLGHEHLSIVPHTHGSTSVRGLGVHWKAEPAQPDAWRSLLAEESGENRAMTFGRTRRERPTEEVKDSADGTDR
jgi:hypothetical protein